MTRASLLLIVTSLAGCAAPVHVERWSGGPTPLEPTSGSVATVASRSGPLALEEVLAATAAHHPTILAAVAEQGVAAGRQLAADGAFDAELRGRALWDPRGTYQNHEVLALIEQPTTLRGLSIFGGYRLGAGDFAVYDGKRRTGSSGEAIAGVRLPLLRDGEIDPARAALQQAAVDVDLAEVALEQQHLELARRAAHEYWGWVAAGRRLEVTQALLGVAAARAEAVTVAVERGELAPVERDENERLLAVRRAFVVAARRAFEQASLTLSLFLRDPAGRPVRPLPGWLPEALPAPSGATPPLPLPRAVARALALRPEPRRLELLARRAGVDLDLASNQALPWVNLTATVEQELTGGGPDGEGALEVTGGVEVRFPLQRRAARGRAAAARAQLEALGHQGRLLQERIEVELRDAASALDAALARHREAARAAELARSLEQAERQAFSLGQSTLFVVNLREQATAEASVLVIEAATEYQRALADWRAALGEE
jgi:outer membrane protein TolC